MHASRHPGSSGTLGSAMAESFSTAGAKLYLVYNSTPPSDSLKESCMKLGAAGVTSIKCNVSQLETCEELVNQVSSDIFGSKWRRVAITSY